MQNWLDSPWIQLPCTTQAMWHAKGHFEVPGYYGDYWYVWATFDGVTYYTMKANYGDFGSCTGWSGSYNTGVELSTLVYDTVPVVWPQYNFQFEIAMFTDGDGCGVNPPSVGGGVGIEFDDFLVDGTTCPSPVEEQSWGRVKSMFK